MLLRSLAVSLLFLSACASTKPAKPKVISSTVDKPYLTLQDACEYAEDIDTATCKGEGFRKALTESAELAKNVTELQKRLEAADAHARIDSWFFDSQIQQKNDEIRHHKKMHWVWAGTGAGAGAVITLLIFIFAN